MVLMVASASCRVTMLRAAAVNDHAADCVAACMGGRAASAAPEIFREKLAETAHAASGLQPAQASHVGAVTGLPGAGRGGRSK